jgi:hypothetical protein
MPTGPFPTTGAGGQVAGPTPTVGSDHPTGFVPTGPGPATGPPHRHFAPAPAPGAAPIQVTSPPRPGTPVPYPPVSGPGGRPPGPPVSGVPHALRVNTGAFPVVSAPPPNTGLIPPVSGPPAPAPAARPPAASPRLPEAALAMLAEARAALSRADAELSDVDARVNRSPGLRNAAIYAAYALLFALVQLPLLATLAASENVAAIVAAPCGAVFVAISFGMAWLTIGAAYRQPGGQRPPRTPFLGALVSLLAATPGFFTLLWMVATAG